MSLYHEKAIRAKIDECLVKVAAVLDANKSTLVQAADLVPHKYEDKYLLANHLTNVGIVSVLNGLELLGISRAALGFLKHWSAHRAVSLKFERKQQCSFVKEIEHDEEDPSRVQVEGIFKTTVRVITKVKEYVYLVEEQYCTCSRCTVELATTLLK